MGKIFVVFGCIDYGTRDLTLAVPGFFMLPPVVNEEGDDTHMGGTTVVLEVGYKESTMA